MSDTAISAEQIRAVENYLKEYRFQGRLVRMDRYEREFFRAKSEKTGEPSEQPIARAKMYEIRHFLMELPNSDEKLLLYYHYIKGESIERCAELLDKSRSSGFRLKKRALELAATYWKKKEESTKASS